MIRKEVRKWVKKEGSLIMTNLNEFKLAGNIWLIQMYQNLKEGGERLSSKGLKKWCKGMHEAIDHVKCASNISRIWCLTW